VTRLISALSVFFLALLVLSGSAQTFTPATRPIAVTSPQRADHPSGAITMPTQDINAYTGYSVDFAGTGTDPKGETVTGTWNFDDGQAATGLTVAHTYMHPGVYTVTFTVTNADGVSDPHPPTRRITVTTYSYGY
jgi:PKD repeat protein